MFSIGIDIEDISRFKNKSEAFLNRIFTKKELDYCFKNKNCASHLAARFCAKEAVIKALSKFSKTKLSYNQIEILNNEDKSPSVNLLVDDFKNLEILVSLSHEKDKAIAQIMIIKK